MSNVPKIAIKELDRVLAETKIPKGRKIYFILSLPRSDMGKGTIVAHLLHYFKKLDAIKFDGLLNTNVNGRHTTKGHDDFGIYEKYNPSRKFGNERFILGGYLYKEFIDKYGEYENLTFRPHFTKYFITKLLEIWEDIGYPERLIVEIGGTISDWEVDPYVTPAIRYFQDTYRNNCTVILLTEIDYNNKYIKTKSAQLALEELLKRMIKPNYILTREPAELVVKSNKERLKIEKYIVEKFEERFGIVFEAKNVLSIPFYKQENIDKLGPYLKKRFFPLLI